MRERHFHANHPLHFLQKMSIYFSKLRKKKKAARELAAFIIQPEHIIILHKRLCKNCVKQDYIFSLKLKNNLTEFDSGFCQYCNTDKYIYCVYCTTRQNCCNRAMVRFRHMDLPRFCCQNLPKLCKLHKLSLRFCALV